jgi:hypothetical protein
MFLKKNIPKEKEKHIEEEEPVLVEEKHCLKKEEQS